MHSLGKLEVVLEGTVEVHFSMVLTFLFFLFMYLFFLLAEDGNTVVGLTPTLTKGNNGSFTCVQA